MAMPKTGGVEIRNSENVIYVNRGEQTPLSVFPSHRAFYNLNPDGVASGGVVAETVPQGPLSALWNLP